MSDKDATYFACDDIYQNDFENAEFSNYMYLSGTVNGIIAGAELAYERHDIDETLPESPNWSQMIKDACKIVLGDETDTRSLYIFRQAVFDLLIDYE